MADRQWLRGRRLRIVVGIGIGLLTVVFLVWAWWTAPHRDLAAALDEVDLPDGLVYLGDEQQGDRTCFFDNCPRLTRYYGSDLEPEEMCVFVENEISGLDETGFGSFCVFQIEALADEYAAFLQVREPISEIPPENDNELIEARPVDISHRSVLYLSIRR